MVVRVLICRSTQINAVIACIFFLGVHSSNPTLCISGGDSPGGGGESRGRMPPGFIILVLIDGFFESLALGKIQYFWRTF